MKLLYVISEYPSVSQTFVVTEAAEVRAQGVDIVGYALAHGQASGSAAELDLVRRPPSKLRLVLAAVRGYRQCFRALWEARRFRPNPREVSRLILAQAHAEYAWPAVRDAGITHVHAHFLGRTSDVALALATKLGCKWSATSHGGDAYAPAEPRLFRRRLRAVSGVACANRGVQRAVRAKAPTDDLRTQVVHCGVDLTALNFSPTRTDGLRVTTVGRLVATKGHWTVMEAASQLLRRDETLQWEIIGAGELWEPLRADERYRELSPRLLLAGPMDHKQTLSEMTGAAAFVLPCEPDGRGSSDGIPVALMEAMALGVPVITTETGGIAELVTDGVTGFIVPHRDPEAVVAALEIILDETGDDRLNQVLTAARQRVEEEFNAPREATTLVRFISELEGVVAVPRQ